MSFKTELSTTGISCHCWNKDRTKLALCPNNNEIHIYEVDNKNNFTRTHILAEHDLLVSGLDWCPTHNRLVSCSHDRNAFVWTYTEHSNSSGNIPGTHCSENSDTGESTAVRNYTGEYKPVLVILRIDLAALSVRWDHSGDKFAVTSSAKCISLCTYEAQNDWWISKLIKKKIKSSVICCAFNPNNNQLLAVGSSDFKCRVYSTFTGDVDNIVNCKPFINPLEFGDIYCELTSCGYINAVAWSASGHTLCFCGHDSSIHFVNFNDSDGSPIVQTIRYSYLPCMSLIFTNERTVISAGFDFNPLIFNYNDNNNCWEFKRFLEIKKNENNTNNTGGVAAARALFQNKSKLGQDFKSDIDTLWTKHENTITCIQNANNNANNNENNNENITKLSTTSLDGSIVIWDLLDNSFGDLTI